MHCHGQPNLVLGEVMCSCVGNPGESNPRPAHEGLSCYHVLRHHVLQPLDRLHWTRLHRQPVAAMPSRAAHTFQDSVGWLWIRLCNHANMHTYGGFVHAHEAAASNHRQVTTSALRNGVALPSLKNNFEPWALLRDLPVHTTYRRRTASQSPGNLLQPAVEALKYRKGL